VAIAPRRVDARPRAADETIGTGRGQAHADTIAPPTIAASAPRLGASDWR
jgi:hypothetical protein